MTKKLVLSYVRWIGLAEGSSLLVLLFVAMPLKYMADQPSMVKWVGAAHGGLFVAYLFVLIIGWIKLNWSFKKLCLGTLLSSVPFGTFIFDHKYLKSEKF